MASKRRLSSIRFGHTVYDRSIFDCVRDFPHDEAFEGHDRILRRYLKPDLLILNDMGMRDPLVYSVKTIYMPHMKFSEPRRKGHISA